MIGRDWLLLGAAFLVVSCSQAPEKASPGSGGLAGISQFASWSYELRAPECAYEEACLADVDGCGGWEANGPNTIYDSCPESGYCAQYSSSIDALWVEPVTGDFLVRGRTVRIGVQVNDSAQVDLYRAADATNPAWVYVSTVTSSSAGNLYATYVLPAGARQAVRAALRPTGQYSPSPCPASGAGDRDDLVFPVDPGDTEPPNVTLTSPAEGAQISGFVYLTAEALDAAGWASTGVAKVEFFAGATRLGTDTTWSYSLDWDARSFPPGIYQLTARATDGMGNVGVSAPVTVTILGDSEPPTVSLEAPGPSVAGVVPLTAFPDDTFGVTGVEFYAADVLLGVDASAPYWNLQWDTTAVPNGTYALTARAFDPSGNVGTSPPVMVTVDNSPGTAAWSSSLGAPLCAEVGAACDSSSHLTGRGYTELHAPSTIHASCADGTMSASYAPQSLEGIRVETEDGGPLEQGKVVLVTARIVAGTSIAPQYADLLAADDANAPSWRYLTTLQRVGSGTLTGRYTLGAGSLQALRVRYSDFSLVVPCSPSPHYEDHDDLAFAVAPGSPDVTLPSVSVTSPTAGTSLNGAFTVQVSASDDRLMGYVEVLVDGNARPPILAAPYQVTLDTSSYGYGYHAISARARDAAGNVAVSAPVTIWFGPPDTTPPSVSITAPGSYVGRGAVLVQATASDNIGVSRVDFFVDGAPIGSDGAAPFQAIWDTTGKPSATYWLTARAYDSSGNSALSGSRGAYVHVNAAAWDSALRALRCGPTSTCDSFDLLTGRSALGPETWAPSTIGGSCADGAAGTFHVEPSIDQIIVSSTTGGPIEAGTAVRIDVKVWSQYWSAEALHLYHAPTAASPAWTLIGTIYPSQAGAQWLSTTYVLPAGAQQAIRARFRSGGAAAPCGTGTKDDHDDLVFSVAAAPPDTTPPTVSLTAPAAGAQVSGAVSLTASASDNRTVARVEFLADGVVIATDTAAPYTATWAAGGVALGGHVLAARAYDGTGNSATSAPVTVSVVAASGAAYDPTYRTVACATVSGRCDSGALFVGRASLGPEANAPNTIGATCADGTGGSFHGDESVEGIEVTTLDGTPMAPGKAVQVSVRVWAYSGYTSDKLDIYTSASATSPSWTLLGTFTPPGAGLRTIIAQYTLPAGATQAVRAQFRYGGSASPCTSGSYDDRDDLVFAVAP